MSQLLFYYINTVRARYLFLNIVIEFKTKYTADAVNRFKVELVRWLKLLAYLLSCLTN